MNTKNKNKNKTKTDDSAECNDGFTRVLYKGDNGSFFVKMKGNDDRMMFVPFTKPKNVKTQNGGWGPRINANAPQQFIANKYNNPVPQSRQLRPRTTEEHDYFNILSIKKELDESETKIYNSIRVLKSPEYMTKEEVASLSYLIRKYESKTGMGITKDEENILNRMYQKKREVPIHTRTKDEEEEYQNLDDIFDYMEIRKNQKSENYERAQGERIVDHIQV